MNDIKNLEKPEVSDIGIDCSGEQGEESKLCAALRRIKKGRDTSTLSETNEYLCLRLIWPKTNICKRLFSVTGFAFTKNRQGLLHVNLQMKLFLKANSVILDASLFHTKQ